MPTTDAASAEPAAGSTRRRLLGAGVAGSVLGVLGLQRASASSGSDTTEGTMPVATEAPTTTTEPPLGPSAADVELLGFLVTAELGASALYEQAAAVAGIDPAATTLYSVLAEHHLAYGSNIASRIGKAAVNVPNAALVDEYTAAFTGTDAAGEARSLELRLIATHLEAVGTLDGLDAAELLASILIVEGQHVAALAALAGLSPAADLDAFVGDGDDPLSADDYPASA